MEQFKVGDRVKLREWVTRDHLELVGLLFSRDEFREIYQLQFTMGTISNHDRFGTIAHLRACGGLGNPWYWQTGTFLKTCYLEVCRG